MKKTVEINGNTFEVIQYDGTNGDEIRRIFDMPFCLRKKDYVIKNMASGKVIMLSETSYETLFPVPKTTAADKWKRQCYKGKYWAINNMFNPQETLEQEDGFDDELYHAANYFATESAAGLYRDKIVLMLQMQRWRDEHDDVALDWTDDEQTKFEMCYRHDTKTLYVLSVTQSHSPFIMHFSSRELAEQCVAATEQGYGKTYGQRMIDIFEREKEMSK